MERPFFYVPNTNATFKALVEEDIPIEQVLRMLGHTFAIQSCNEIARPAVYDGLSVWEYDFDGGSLENAPSEVPGRQVQAWTVPLGAVELKSHP